MSGKMSHAILVVLSILLTFANSGTWAAKTHRASKVVKKRGGAVLKIVEENSAKTADKVRIKVSDKSAEDEAELKDVAKDRWANGEGTITAKIKEKSLDDYMEGEDVDAVEVTIEVDEMLVRCEKGLHYALVFTCGPSGAYFETPLKLEIKGKYVATGCHIWLYDEFGEALEAEVEERRHKITFYINHFSSYYYDDYDY